MSIKFKAIERTQPGVTGGGEKKFYASANVTGEKDLEGITKLIEKISTVSGADIRAVLYALVDVAIDELADGKIIRLGDLGSLRVSLSSAGVTEEKDVTASVIKGTSIIFTPGKKLKQMQNNLEFEKI
jgi:predicted histone-like DNA-binding protein